jgi:hypothetical protein
MSKIRISDEFATTSTDFLRVATLEELKTARSSSFAALAVRCSSSMMMGRCLPSITAAPILDFRSNTVDGDDSTGFNFGAIYDFNDHDHFVFSAGRGLQNADTTNDFSWYVGFLLTGP